MVDFIDRRKFFRMKIDCEIHCKNDDGNYVYMGQCTSLSGSGISFITSKKLTLKDSFNVTINPNQTLTSAMVANVVIIRIMPLKNDEFEIGATLEIL